MNLIISSVTALQAANYKNIQLNGSALIVIYIIFRHALTRNIFSQIAEIITTNVFFY